MTPLTRRPRKVRSTNFRRVLLSLVLAGTLVLVFMVVIIVSIFSGKLIVTFYYCIFS